MRDGREWQSVRTAWSPDEQILPLDLDLLPYGDAELKVRYVVGEDVMAMPDGRLRVLTSRVVARYRFAGSDPVQGVTFEATLRTEAAVGALPLALDVRYRPLGGTWAAVYPEPPVVSVHLGPDEPAVFQYTVAVPPGEGELSVMLRAPDSVEFLDAGDTFHVAPVPPLVLRPVHPHLEPKEGEAAIVARRAHAADWRLFGYGEPSAESCCATAPQCGSEAVNPPARRFESSWAIRRSKSASMKRGYGSRRRTAGSYTTPSTLPSCLLAMKCPAPLALSSRGRTENSPTFPTT